MAERVGLGCGEVDESGLDVDDASREVGGVCGIEECLELGSRLLGEDAAVDHALERGAS